MTDKARKGIDEWLNNMESGVIEDALQGTTFREMERKYNLGRKLGRKERLFLKQILKAVRFVLEGKRDIGVKYATLREFEQKRNWNRAIADPENRGVLRALVRTKVSENLLV